ncbi:MAG: nicotinate (nicotinamide) nucleotide adenylyltransferase [Verrucomicrobiota bacterium]|nr:nicotinate (nicotinamide) nucleotide adenylyltransferase [Verrucomicrobiota bacterium]
MKIGFFGGTFDPIHVGHLNLALQLSESEGLDEVIFSPAYCSPFKEARPPVASGEDRLEMVRLAIQDISRFRVTDYEVRKEVPSYTIDAIRHFAKNSPAFFHLILSEESAHHFFEWKEADLLLHKAFPLIGVRSFSQEVPEALRAGVREIRAMDISSTDIRDRLQQGLYSGHLVPHAVLSYIHKRRLYQQ